MYLISRLRFRTKLNLGMSAILIIMAALLLPLVGSMTTNTLVKESKKRGAVLVESLAVRAVDPMLAQDFFRLKNMVDEQIAVGDVVYVFVQDNHGHVLAHTFHKGFPVDLIRANIVSTDEKAHIQLLADGLQRIYDFAAPVIVARERLGTVRVGLSKTRIDASVNRQLVTLAGLFAGALFLTTALVTVFARRVTHRLALLREHAEAMLVGNLDTRSGLADCSAFGERGRRCWCIAGTNSDEATGSHDACCVCKKSEENIGDELQNLAETFDAMALTLKTHIDDLRGAEQSLRDQQRLMRTILDVTPDRVSLVDTRVRYQGANRSFADHVGMELDDIVGKTDFDLFEEQVAEKRHLWSRDILQSGERLDKQVKIVDADGERWFHVVSIPVYDDNGNITGLLRTDRDITDIKGYEKQLLQAQKMESLGLMAGGVAHEINTPLGIVLGYAQLLQEDVEKGSQMHQDLGIIEKQTKVCKKIVADLLGFSRQSHSSKREMCFNNSVMEAISLVRHTFSLDHVEIVTELDDRFPIIYGDPEKLKQVWINLLNNARDAMSTTGGVVFIRTLLDTPHGTVTLWIADSGEGIEQEKLKNIFDPFYSTKPVGLGTGLGLSVSFGIIEEHDGHLSVASPVPTDFDFPSNEALEVGPGTLFEVVLPFDHDKDREDDSDRESEADDDGMEIT